ncbi:MAG: LptF/LptG family permease [Bacteroidota bacterium]|nr:LptF/LptG family permease [Bacteroidota bacterium]
MRRIDVYIAKQFLLNLLLCFSLSMVVFILNTVWLYIDELIGKGINIQIVLELFSNLIFKLVPTATTTGILVASVMTWGQLSEYFELTAMKASGISMIRTFRSVIIIILLLGGFSFYLSNQVIPVKTYNFYSLMFDIHTTKPEIDIPEGQFYNQLEGFSIKVDRKNSQSGMMYGIMIYDHTKKNSNPGLIMADSGNISLLKTQSQLAFKLYHGSSRYEEVVHPNSVKPKSIRKDYFDSQIISFADESGVLKRKNSNIYNYLYLMLSGKQLRDTINALQDEYSWKKKLFGEQWLREFSTKDLKTQDVNQYQMASVITTENPAVLFRAQETARRQAFQLTNLIQDSRSRKRWIAYFQLELHKRFAIIITGLSFFLIGAPLGGILKKGGLGTPVVISTFIYICYHIMTNMGVKQAKLGLVSPFLGVWIPVIILLILAIMLVIASNQDQSRSSFTAISSPLKNLFSFVKNT